MATLPSSSESKSRKETRPERYLREIRDLQQQNNILLQKLTTVEEKKESRRTLSIMGKTLMILLPYLFSIFVAWAFYTKVEDTFESLKGYITLIPESISEKFSFDTGNIKDNALKKGSEIIEKWNNKNN